MILKSFERIVSDEKKSFSYLLTKLDNIQCPTCGSRQYYVMKRRRIRCRKCRKDYNPLLYSQFSKINISYSAWLILLRLFAQAFSAREASQQSEIPYKTVLRSFQVMRKVILQEMDRDSLASGRGMGKRMNAKIKSNTGKDKISSNQNFLQRIYHLKEM